MPKLRYFKELKDKIATSKLFSSLDRLDVNQSIKEEDTTTPKTQRGKMVKNLNEFLNFAQANRDTFSDKLARMRSLTEGEKPKILLTKSSLDDSESNSSQTRHCSSTSNDDTFDECSPDDSQEYFPLTTSVTKELRLELESLDRKVFGDNYVDRLSSESPSCCDTSR